MITLDNRGIQPTQIIRSIPGIAEGNGRADQILEVAWTWNGMQESHNLAEQTHIAIDEFDPIQIPVEHLFSNVKKVGVFVAVEVDDKIEPTDKRLVEMLEEVGRRDEDDVLVQVIETFQDRRRRSPHFTKVVRIGAVERDGIKFVKKDENFFGQREAVEFLE